ncbi:MAG: 4Fe-4S dicluster domain-containing protein [Armatimonadetes bacterium]|nr:4Fe-4S dicluster domain-containing protein [Armatimonadota bacterium]
MPDSQQPSRSDFLKSTGRSLLLIGVGAAGYGAWTNLTTKITRHKPERNGRYTTTTYSMGIDIEKCIGCGHCVDACAKENAVPDGHFRTWIERYVIKKDGTVLISSPNGGKDGFRDDVPADQVERAFFVPKLCNHCTDSPCTQVCPVGATFITDDGVVLVDYDYCVGCRYCIQACPYGSRFWNPQKHTADKCTLCYHRVTKGQEPACVEVCPTGARIFGDLSKEDSPVSAFLKQNPTMVLKPNLKTGAKIAYKGLSKEVV